MHRFEKQKGSELKKMMIAFAKIHLQFCEKVNGADRLDIHASDSLSFYYQNMISWQRTRQQVETMAISD